MTLPGETILMGAPQLCPECLREVYFETLPSPAGWYTGTRCIDCGPCTRESEYFADPEDANHLTRVLNSVASSPGALNSFCYLLLNGFKLRGFS